MKRFTTITLKVLAAFFFFLYLLIWLVSPMVSNHFIEKNISQFDITLNESSTVRYNPFISQIKIDDFTLEKANKPVFSIEKLTVEMNLLQLIFDKLHIKSVIAEGIHGGVIINGDKITVAGVTLPQAIDKPATEQDSDKSPTETKPATAYQLVMPLLTIKDSKIDVSYNNEDLAFEINAITVESLVADQQAQSANLALDISLAESNVKLTADAQLINGQGEIDSHLDISQFDLAIIQPWLPENIRDLTGLVSVNSQQKLFINDINQQLKLSDTKLTLTKLAAVKDNVQLSIEESTTQFSNIDVLLTNNQPPTVSANGQFDMTNLDIANAENPQLLVASIAKVAVNSIDTNTIEAKPIITLNSIMIEQAIVSQDNQSDLPALTQFSQLLIDNLVVSEQAADINIITLADLKIDAQINADKKLTSLLPIQSIQPVEQSATNNDATQEPESIEKTEKAAFQFSLNDFHLTNNAIINFKDHSVKPIFQQIFTIEELQFNQLNSRNPELKSTLKLRGKNNRYAHFDFDGVMQPFVEQPLYAVKGGIKEVSLPAISSYIKNALSFEIKTGQLDFNIDTTLTGDKISGKSKILLRGFDFTAADDHEADSLKDQTAIPLSVALGMLKDSKGNVDLSLPISGNTNDPSFGLSGLMTLLVKQATMMAAKDYLMTTFVPYANVVSVAMTAGKMLLKVRLNDLPYVATHSDITEDQQVFIKQFALLLKDKPDTQVTLCAISTPADVGLKTGEKVKDHKFIEQLHQLSLLRVENFKHHIVDKYKVASSRLLLCTPQIDSAKNAKPRITFDVN
ncbi:DUF748 domain-containing protein [Colwellia sp. 1_MG-2023]|uniref:DUF748 domain-containing protein n=1 Tax=Colwellia sp. 1_MG-2023 TaxID=3062649 RepID=UPI0026E17EAF|nr:DUF748 domain-containing protein [Colwellia sp. 1_MG-2023]MDO6447544.1 DUF748 domain-containing protein [Colwellia sp. 1_MG-2023]